MRARSLVLAILVALAAVPAEARHRSNRDSCPEQVQSAGLTYQRLRPSDIDMIFKICKGKETRLFGEVQRRYFGDVYDPSLTDLVVFVDSLPDTHEPYRVQAALVRGGEVEDHLVLRGDRKLWVLVLSDRCLKTLGQVVKDPSAPKMASAEDLKAKGKNKAAAAKKDKDPKNDPEGKGGKDDKDKEEPPDVRPGSIKMSYRFEPLAFAPSSGERTIRDVLGAFFDKFAGAGGDKTDDKNEVVTGELFMEPRGEDSNGNPLYAGVFGLDLPTNSVNRVVLHPVGSGPLHSVHLNFSQFSASRLGGSLGLGYQFRKSGDERQGDRVGAYLMAHYYVGRPRLPVSTFCYGPLVGTNLTDGGLKNYLVLGARVTVVGQSGIWGGVNILGGHVFQEGIVAGLDYRL